MSGRNRAGERVSLETFLEGLGDESAAQARVAAARIDRLALVGDRMEGIERRYLPWAAAGAVLFLVGLWMLVDPRIAPGWLMLALLLAALPATGDRVCLGRRPAHARRPRIGAAQPRAFPAAWRPLLPAGTAPGRGRPGRLDTAAAGASHFQGPARPAKATRLAPRPHLVTHPRGRTDTPNLAPPGHSPQLPRPGLSP